MWKNIKNWFGLLPFIVWSEINSKSLKEDGWKLSPIKGGNSPVEWCIDSIKNSFEYNFTLNKVGVDRHILTYVKSKHSTPLYFVITGRYELYKLTQTLKNNIIL